jgi:hypothetical protein
MKDKVLFIVVCAWCGKVKYKRLMDRPVSCSEDKIISHGACDACAKKEITKIRNIPVSIRSR